MTNLLQRYQRGFHKEVYDELVALGEKMFMSSIYEEAQAVAQTLMQRVRYNIGLIVPRLHTLGYRFGEGMWGLENEISPGEKLTYEKDVPIFGVSTENTLIYIQKLEGLIGNLPLSLLHWYQEVGCVNFVGLFPSDEKRVFDRQDGCDLDPLLIYSVELVYKMVLGYKERNVWEKDPTLPVSPDNLFKYDYSGSGPYVIRMPCKAFDAPLLRERHNTTFINYLRICMQWGGFPGLEQHNKLSREEFTFLTKDLLPF
jgi:hypothetical protein